VVRIIIKINLLHTNSSAYDLGSIQQIKAKAKELKAQRNKKMCLRI
jgi:hypothetical protein